MSRVVRPWTALEVRRLRAWRAAGLKIGAIARRLGRSYGAVSMYLSRVLLTRPNGRRGRGALERAVRRLAAPGLSDAELGRRLGVPRGEIYRVRRRLGIPAGVRAVDGWRFRRAAPTGRSNRPPQCLNCSTFARRASAGASLASQGWWVGEFSANRVAYCPDCLERHGPPDLTPFSTVGR